MTLDGSLSDAVTCIAQAAAIMVVSFGVIGIQLASTCVIFPSAVICMTFTVGLMHVFMQ